MTQCAALVRGVRPSLPGAIGVVAVAWSLALAAQPCRAQEDPFQRPTYQFLRYNEDWSALRGVSDSELTDFWDPIKYIPLSEDGETWLSTDGSIRLRYEG